MVVYAECGHTQNSTLRVSLASVLARSSWASCRYMGFLLYYNSGFYRSELEVRVAWGRQQKSKKGLELI